MSELMSAVKENGVIEGQFRDLNTITYEIRTIYHNVLEYELISAVRLGRKLQEAKSIVGHGEWGKWIKNNLPFSQDKAEIMLKIYKNYGSSQESIFGELNSDIYRNLGVSQAFALLSVPEEEREEFVKENRADEMSVRELKKAIAERDAEKEKREKAEAGWDAEVEEREKLEIERDALKTKAEALDADNRMLRKSNEELNKKAQDAQSSMKEAADAKQRFAEEKTKAEAAIEKAKTAELKAEEYKVRYEELKKNPEIPAEVLEKIRAEAKETAKTASETEMQERDRRITELEKKLAMSSPEIAAFKTHFTQLQETQRKIEESLAKIRTADAATAEKLLAAIAAAEKAFAERVGVKT